MPMIRYSDDDRRRMREEAAEQAEVSAEYYRIRMKYAGVAKRPTTPAEQEEVLRQIRLHERLYRHPLRPWPE
jgi:hypothetical protein